MFDLEQSIADWRKQMLAGGIKTPAPLEELEIHLREEIEQQMKSELSEQKAFEIAAEKIGQVQRLKNEFRKNEKNLMKQFILIVVAFLAGAALQIPGSLQLRSQLVMADGKLGIWLLGFVLQLWSANSLWRMIRPASKNFEFENFKMSFSRILKTGIGATVLLAGALLMIPAGIQACRDGLVKFDSLCWLVFGFALLMAGVVVTFCPYKKRAA